MPSSADTASPDAAAARPGAAVAADDGSVPGDLDDRELALAQSSDLLWHGLEWSGRGPKPTLSLDRIVTAAIEVADAEGVEALAMRRIARRLGVGAMSLYRYVPGKSTLLDLMLDHLSTPSDEWSSAELDAATPQWRAALELSARESRRMYLDHPWLIRLNWSRPVFGPNTIASLEVVMRRMRDLPVTDRERMNIFSAVDSYVTGTVRQELLYLSAPEETGVSEERFWATQLPVLERAMKSGDYPALADMAEDTFAGDWDETFEMGLAVVLDGIAVLAARRSGG